MTSLAPSRVNSQLFLGRSEGHVRDRRAAMSTVIGVLGSLQRVKLFRLYNARRANCRVKVLSVFFLVCKLPDFPSSFRFSQMIEAQLLSKVVFCLHGGLKFQKLCLHFQGSQPSLKKVLGQALSQMAQLFIAGLFFFGLKRLVKVTASLKGFNAAFNRANSGDNFRHADHLNSPAPIAQISFICIQNPTGRFCNVC